eukprot:TRINITY_DN17299_c1_g1_i1.p1 TRINITY_DN17299_c1_g1~~TRINITY_DN17299_c1_g1_i1.p1  ORF type:complete len:108 (-),score=27.25 TRINITY_DN17299_c1_g1_i1:93-416(-)
MWSLGVVLYVLLSGTPPFEEDGLYDQILQGRYEFDAEEWMSISRAAKDLVRSLMTVDRHQRPSIQQALEFPWLKANRSGLNSSKGSSEDAAVDEPSSKRARIIEVED